jgi:putative tryptophan/tyrosine transport system substrate-binding protein
MIQRRDFITLLGGAAAWPVAARAQQVALPVVGFLNSNTSEAGAPFLAGFRQGLREERFADGDNVIIQPRWADGQYDRLPALATDLVSRRVAVISAGGPPAAQAAKAATSTIPIVFTSGGDAVQLGLVRSLARPGGNVTGVSFLNDELSAKRLSLLHDLVPKAEVIALLLNPSFVDASDQVKGAQDAARSIGLSLEVVAARNEHEIDNAFARTVELRAGALIVAADPFMFGRRETIVTLAANHGLPAIYNLREFVRAGGLMSYDTSITDAYRQAGVYVGRILKGARPGDLPVVQPTRFEFAVNLKAAKALGLTVPGDLVSIADEVIE